MHVESLMEIDIKPIVTDDSVKDIISAEQINLESQSTSRLLNEFLCDVCKMSFSSKSMIEQHMNTVHTKASQNRYINHFKSL